MKRLVLFFLVFCGCLMPPSEKCVSEVEGTALITYRVGQGWIVDTVSLNCEQITDADGNIVWRCIGKDTLKITP